MSILKIEPNKPLQLSLKYKGGTEAPGKYGLQFRYVLSTGDLLYLPPIAHEEIKALNPAPGEPFTLLKTVGNGNGAVWSVERVPQPKPIAAARSISSAAEPLPPSLTTPESRRMFRQLVATIEAVKAAEEFSVSIGRPVSFNSDDIRAMSISNAIEQSRRAA